MTTRRQMIIDRMLASKAPGPTADQLARALGMTLVAVMGQMKLIRKEHKVVATPHVHDARIKHYHFDPAATINTKPKAAPPDQPALAPKAKAKNKATLSATELEAAITEALRTHASARRPMDMPTLCDQVDAPAAMVRPAIIALVQRETVTRVKGGYHLPEVVLYTPQTVAKPRQVDVMAGIYTGAELRPFDGRPGAMAAYALPSRGMGV